MLTELAILPIPLEVFRNYYIQQREVHRGQQGLDQERTQELVICGKLILYQGVAPEIDSGNYIVSIN